MNTDVSRNVVVFQLKRRKGKHAVAEGPTRHDDCIQQAWQTVQREHSAAAKDVVALHSEWEPSPADASFIRTSFPKAALTYNFSRPGPDGWDAAFAAARRVIAEAGAKQATENMRLVAERGELLPVLWSDASPKKELLEYVPHEPIAPGRLYVALATVGPTPQGTIGMSHVTHGGLEGRTFEALLAEAAANLTRGLNIDGHTDPVRPERGALLAVRRDGPFGASALALPDFYDRISGLIGRADLVAGAPDPDTLLVTAAGGGWVDEVERAVLTSPCPPGELVPALLSMTPSGVQVLAEKR